MESNLKKSVTLDVDIETGSGFKKFMQDINNIKQRTDMYEFVFGNDDRTKNVVPIISIGTEKLLFRTKCLMRKSDIDAIEKELSEKIGIKCAIIDPHIELVAVIDG